MIGITGKGVTVDWQEGARGIGGDIPQGLEPAGDSGWYMTPDEPADPMDCDRYPDSPWCGGMPFTRKPIGLDVEPVINECGVAVTVKPTLGFTKLPPASVAWLAPECRRGYGERPPFIPPPTPDRKITPTKLPKDIDPNKIVLMLLGLDVFTYSAEKPLGVEKVATSYSTSTVSAYIDFHYPGINKYLYYDDNGRSSYLAPIAECKFVNAQSSFTDEQWNINRNYGDSAITVAESYTSAPVYLFSNNSDFDSSVGFLAKIPFYGKYFGYFGLADALMLYGRYGAIYERYNGLVVDRSSKSQTEYIYQGKKDFVYGAGMGQAKYNILYLSEVSFEDNPPPPFDIGKRKCDCMQCCSPNPFQAHKEQQDNAEILALLRLINRKLGEYPAPVENKPPDELPKPTPIKTVANGLSQLANVTRWIIEKVGLKELPAELPKRLIYPNAKGEEKIPNLLEVLGYQVRQVDRAVGYLPQKIKVADTNPGKEGNQSVEVEIHSFADFSREIMQYVIDSEGDLDTALNMLVRILYELGFIHQGAVQGNAMLDAIVEHLDFKQKWKKMKVPFAFDPYAGQKGKVGQGFGKQENAKQVDQNTEEATEALLGKLLQNTEVEIKVLVNEERKSLNDLIQDIKRDTAIAAAGSAEKATPERLEELVAACQEMIRLQGVIDRRNVRAGLAAGNLVTRKKQKDEPRR